MNQIEQEGEGESDLSLVGCGWRHSFSPYLNIDIANPPKPTIFLNNRFASISVGWL